MTETKMSSQLAQGDLVLTHGMRVRLTAPIPTHRDGVHAWSGHVENYREVIAEGHVPASFIRNASWTIQGTDCVNWTVAYSTRTER